MYIHLQAPIPELWVEQGHDGFSEIRGTLLEEMAGTARLELATSAVTVLREYGLQLTRHTGAAKRRGP
jgi:hypothetical protein